MKPVTADDILCGAKEIIVNHGWARNAYPQHGPAPRSIRSALQCAARVLDAEKSQAHTDAIHRVSEALYGRGVVGGILDYEHYKRTTRDSVVSLLQKAIEMGPADKQEQHCGVWPV